MTERFTVYDAHKKIIEQQREIERLKMERDALKEHYPAWQEKEINRMRSALERLDSLAQDPKNVRIMRQAVRKIVREALREVGDG